MGKLRLKMEDLRVETFRVRPDAPGGRGTVHGQESGREGGCAQSYYDLCEPSYEKPCYWTGDPRQDCYAPSALNVCTDYPGYC
ncbi:hypothetical protein [Longimicrobium terrae]|uniref:Uncharacterized protein n=1 Tax=Longimicrobium terrae TaxID=1639882 RepID=A0A841GLC9_9BACT|nr:hypothetical protein [Longimicrobium terrae]MBB4635013.1 hypothetical protein [Longimicrobium terrae]MBB6069407.1 hypothetical protein [Longimicrobium terrae]NNC31787.1 hypothetical protein [Longimicrobium terrae]